MRNKKGNMLPLAVVVIIVLIVIGLFIVKLSGFSIIGESKEHDKLANKISLLEELNLESVENYESYKIFADRMNLAILIISEQTKINIPKLKTTQEAWGKASKIIIKYGPLIDNYNSLVSSAKIYDLDRTEENYNLFYKELGVFSLEFTFISATLFHQVTFKLVGGVFRGLGIGSLALKCPTCASAIMSTAYWALKGVLVESASSLADSIFKNLGYNFS